MRCIDLCCVSLLCVLFVVVCRLALLCAFHRFVLRFVALRVVRCDLQSCVDLCVALICVAFGICVVFVVVCCLALRLVAWCVVRCDLPSFVDLYIALICVAFGCFVCCSLWFVVLPCVWLLCVLFVVVCRLALICALRCVALVAGHDCFRGFVASTCSNAHST